MASSDPQAPAQVAGFRLLEEVARGGMGTVYRAHQLSMDRTVAVKLLAPKYTQDDLFIQRFLKEARSAARLNHPNIIQAIDVGQAEGWYYFAMEFVEGTTLARLLRDKTKLPPAEATGIILQIARAIEHSARLGMLHLDIKPGNIMITPAGLAKLGDFGLARHIEEADAIYAQKRIMFGTPMYMSVEQIRGGELDCRSDIYSLGITFYELVTGRNPFHAPDNKAVLEKVKAGEVRPAHEVEPSVPADISAVIAKMTAQDREARYASPADLLTDLEALSRLQPPPVALNLPQPQAVQPARARSWIAGVALAAALVALVAALATAAAMLLRRSPQLPLPVPTESAGEEDPLRQALDAALTQARVAEEAGDYAGALRICEQFVAEHPGTEAAEEAVRAAGEVLVRVSARMSDLMREAQERITAGDFDGAEGRADAIALLPLSDAAQTAQDLRQRIKEGRAAASQAAEESGRKAASERFAALETEIAAMEKKELFDDATRAVEKFLANPENASRFADARSILARINLLRQAQSLVLAGAARSSGYQPAAMPGATVAGAGGGKIIVRAGGVERRLSLGDMDPLDLTALARLGGGDAYGIESALAVLLFTQGRNIAAAAHFDEAARLRGNGTAPEWFLDMDCLALMRAAGDELDKGSPREAQRALRSLKNRRQRSRLYQERMPELRSLYDRVRTMLTNGMKPVPAGRFRYGEDSRQYLPLYYIDKYETTNAEYARFLEYLRKTGDISFDHPAQPEEKASHVPLDWETLAANRPDYPVVGVDWYDAFAYAQWRGKRLPTEQEWEKAARGTDGRKFPWGPEWINGVCNAPSMLVTRPEDLPTDLAPVGSFPRGDSPFGVSDMAGNAREWVAGETSGKEENAATRGGSFMDSSSYSTTTERRLMRRVARDRATGFRCVTDAFTDQP